MNVKEYETCRRVPLFDVFFAFLRYVFTRQTKKLSTTPPKTTNMLTRWEPETHAKQSHSQVVPRQQHELSTRHMPTSEAMAAPQQFAGFRSTFDGAGNVVYRSSTSRVYSLNGNCAEERRAEQDRRTNTENISVTRVLGSRSATYTQHKDLVSGKTEMQRSAVNVVEDGHRQFDSDWMRAAEEFLPPYNDSLKHQQRAALFSRPVPRLA
jgi:hypothetical protein